MNRKQEAIAELKRAANTLFMNFFIFLIPSDIEPGYRKSFQNTHPDLDVNVFLDIEWRQKKISDGSFLKIVYGCSKSPIKTHPGMEVSLNVVLDVLRICIAGISKEENLTSQKPIDRLMNSKFPKGLESKPELASAFKSLLDEKLEIKVSDRPPTTFSIRPCFRVLAEESMRYINLLNERNLLLKCSEPIGVCPECNGIFLKKRTDQIYCSTRCKSASWVDKTGNAYFAKKAKKNRQIKKAARERQKSNNAALAV